MSWLQSPTRFAHMWYRRNSGLSRFCMVNKLDERKTITWSTMHSALAKKLVTRMLTRDLFAVAITCLVFTEQRHAQARSLLSAAVCPSVRPSVMLVDCIQMAEDIVKLLSRPGSTIILFFFDPERRYPIPRDPFSRGAKYTGWKFFLRFSTEISVYLGNGTRGISPWLVWNVNKKSYVTD